MIASARAAAPLVGINAFHVLLAPAGTVVPLVLVALELVVVWSHRA